MSITLQLDELDETRLSIEPRQLCELLALLHVIAEPHHHRDRAREIAILKRAMPMSLQRELERLAPLWARLRLRAMMPLSSMPSPANFAQELKQLAELPIDAFMQMAAEAVAGRRLNPEVREDYSSELILDLSRKRSVTAAELATEFHNPERFRSRLVDVLEHCHQSFFRDVWGGLGEQLRAVSQQQAEQNTAQLFSELSYGSFYLEKSRELVFDKLQDATVDAAGREVILVPSNWAAPHVTVKFDEMYANVRLPIVITYPVGVAAQKSQGLFDVAERMQTLSNSSRMELIRHLVSESSTTSDLAIKLHMTEPQVSRHLRKLREVGLLESERSGRQIKHRLRTNLVYQLGHNYLSALTR